MTTTETYSFLLAKEISDRYLSEIIELRKTHYYDSMYDEHYWNGGVYNVVDIEVKEGRVDESSKYAMILNKHSSLVAYARYSTAYKKSAEYAIAKLHIIMSAKDIIGQIINIDVDGKVVSSKASEFLLKAILADCERQNSSRIISEICIFPYPNLPSLNFHKKHGFVCAKLPLDTLHSQNGDMVFTALCRDLNNVSVSDR